MTIRTDIYQPLIKYLLKQASKPTGVGGHVITKIWSYYFKDLSNWSFRHIDITKQSTVLDVGIGGGANIRSIRNQDALSIIYGIDISKMALKSATKANRECMKSGGVTLAIGDVTDLQFKDDFFDFIIATQTHIYWSDLKMGLKECLRVLKKNGILLISCEIDKIEYHLPEYHHFDDFASLLYKIGYRKVSVKNNHNYVAFICIK